MDRLLGRVQRYDWGDTDAIPRALGQEPDGGPQAELWLGAHPVAPATVVRGGAELGLDRIIEQDACAELGDAIVADHGPTLPFLLKLLAAAKPLSLQVHPTREQAAAGFAREEAAGVPRDAPDRTYRDENHKPELLCALTSFRALCGFRAPVESAADLRSICLPELDALADRLEADEDGLPTVVADLLSRPDRERGALAAAVRTRLADGGGTDDVRAWFLPIAEEHPGDAGLVLALLLHRLTLQPGEAIYLDAGHLHAYVAGLGIELMASSDNVVRGGLTTKHVDREELLRILTVAPSTPQLVRPREVAPGVDVYDTPAPEFELTHVRFPEARELHLHGPAVVLCLDGEVRGSDLVLGRGDASFVGAARPTVLSGTGSAYVARVGASRP